MSSDIRALDNKLSGNLSGLDNKFLTNLSALDTKFMSALGSFETRMLKWFVTMGIGFAALWISSLGIVFALVEAGAAPAPPKVALSEFSTIDGINRVDNILTTP
jgi:hypothetical protein